MESYGGSVDACTETHSGNGQDLGELARLVGPVTGASSFNFSTIFLLRTSGHI